MPDLAIRAIFQTVRCRLEGRHVNATTRGHYNKCQTLRAPLTFSKSHQVVEDLAAGALVRLLPEGEPALLPVYLVTPERSAYDARGSRLRG
jgi:hypothetical protein